MDGLSELLVTSLDDLEKYYEQGNRARNIGMLGVKNECAKLVEWCGVFFLIINVKLNIFGFFDKMFKNIIYLFKLIYTCLQ